MSEIPRKVGIHHDAVYERHDTGPGHPESIHRYQVLAKALATLPDSFIRLPRRTAEISEILLAHEHYYHDLVYQDVESFAHKLRSGDTAICEESYDVAREATGALLTAVDAVMDGRVASAFCAVRPPGHHATATRGMGFCIFNHVAIAARYLQQRHRLRRIAIIDWDVHHGNGTEDIFIEDPSVYYVSLHEDGSYPGTGPASERGRGKGLGTTLNIPLQHASDGKAALDAWDAQITPALDAFQPEFVLVSAGFDARHNDPLGGLNWDDETFAAMTRRCLSLANRHAQGRIASVLEGGYHPEGLASAALAHVRALAQPLP